MSALCRSCGASNRDQAAFCVVCGQPLAPATATGALAAQTLLNGRYEIARRIGGGGMGAVYQAFDFQQDRVVAIKEMSDQALGTGHREQAVEQFRREALFLQALSHPNLVKVTDTFSDGRRHYLVMDYVDGRPLTSLIAPQQEGWQEQVRAWALQLCDVLNYLHTRQPAIIFRDLKPDNILAVDGEAQLKLIDFGIARFFDPAKERDTMAIGTPGFMAPEAFYGQTDARSDLYSLGVTLHTLLTGYDPSQSPWQLPPVEAMAPQVAEDLAQIVAHAIELDPEQRFQTAQEFKRALGGEVAPEGVAEAAPAAAPVAARVSTARPVRFNGREQVTSLPQLIGLCETHWDAAVNHLRVGELEVWLDYLGETQLAAYARELRQDSGMDMAAQLETWLAATGRVTMPVLAVSPPRLTLGTVSNQTPSSARLHLQNLGRGLLFGRVDSDVYWLVPERATFAANDQVVPLRVLTDRLPVGTPVEGHLRVRSNGGESQVTVTLRAAAVASTPAEARPPAWAAGVLLFLAVAGGVWLIGQLAGRWSIPPEFDVAAWAKGGKGWLMLPLASIVLTLAAMLGSIHQWERLAADAPLRVWLVTAAWVFGVTLLTALVSGLVFSLVDVPRSLSASWRAAADALPVALPVLIAALAAVIAASGRAERLRSTASGAVILVVLLVLWLVLVVAGIVGGAWLAGQLDDLLPRGLPDAGYGWVTLLGLAIGAGLGALPIRLAGKRGQQAA